MGKRFYYKEEKMKNEPCAICHGDMTPGFSTQTYDLNDSLLVIRRIPALVCNQCGDAIFTTDTVKILERITNDFKKSYKSIKITEFDNVA
jgi:YgiT-type zinc finger domain-containing protein